MVRRVPDRGPLSRAEIVTAALELAEADGLEKLSLAKVAAAVGVQTMSLYNHVVDKADLLGAMADAVVAAVVIPDVDGMTLEEGARALAHAFRAAALRYPNTAPLLLVRRLNAPSILPMVDTALRLLRAAGLDEAEAVRVLRAYIAYVVGTLLRELGMTRPAGEPPAPVLATDATDLMDLIARFPSVAGSAFHLAVIDHEAEFNYGLDLLLASVRQRLEAGR